MARKNRQINLPAPYLRKVWLDPSRVGDRKAYPYCLPFLSDEFELSFDKPITIIVGENGAGKSTLPREAAALGDARQIFGESNYWRTSGEPMTEDSWANYDRIAPRYAERLAQWQRGEITSAVDGQALRRLLSK